MSNDLQLLNSYLMTAPTNERDTWEKAHAWYHAATQCFRDVPCGEFSGHIELSQIYEKLDASKEDAGDKGARCRKMLRFANWGAQAQTIEYSKPEKRTVIDQVLDALVTPDQVLTAEEVDGIKALGRYDGERWQHDRAEDRGRWGGLWDANEGDIKSALALAAQTRNQVR